MQQAVTVLLPLALSASGDADAGAWQQTLNNLHRQSDHSQCCNAGVEAVGWWQEATTCLPSLSTVLQRGQTGVRQ